MRFQTASTDRSAAFCSRALSLANTRSIGFRSGLQGGKKRRWARAWRIARRTALPLWLAQIVHDDDIAGLERSRRFLRVQAGVVCRSRERVSSRRRIDIAVCRLLAQPKCRDIQLAVAGASGCPPHLSHPGIPIHGLRRRSSNQAGGRPVRIGRADSPKRRCCRLDGSNRVPPHSRHLQGRQRRERYAHRSPASRRGGRIMCAGPCQFEPRSYRVIRAPSPPAIAFSLSRSSTISLDTVPVAMPTLPELDASPARSPHRPLPSDMLSSFPRLGACRQPARE